jgi:microsomal dipeptidase-like Zn-dependent dipeptidase
MMKRRGDDAFLPGSPDVSAATGTDLDGFTDPPDDCDSEARLPRIRTMLESHDVPADDVEAVLGGNARRALRAGWR